MKKIIYIIISILVCFLVGYTARYFQSESIVEWYPHLVKSSLSPPDIVFPIVWSILYICMGLSVGLIITSDRLKEHYYLQSFFIQIFFVQLFFNFMWSITFFYLQSPIFGLINILLLLGVIIYYIIETYSLAKVSSILFFPYLAWVAFASYLNLYIVIYN
ncbi:tryptophan-rich sensory protein [Dysgonomonas sp. Marseille-P4677]|uniref:TspO/MBR family protein n=1 Tax=Dysgonomonas sp. Marseille-P4677 TaxID=2364790 RepID=UPI0019123ADC|nr:TspO/MBR family protein [Dysgonomonas sp. Marseille-P4677]MBK5721851.1 tryptophan-rich sensory protein [Dysgonomonas sp. Marseille-P4677]